MIERQNILSKIMTSTVKATTSPRFGQMDRALGPSLFCKPAHLTCPFKFLFLCVWGLGVLVQLPVETLAFGELLAVGVGN